MSPKRKIVATLEVFFKGHIFPEVTVLTTPDLADIGSDRKQREETSNGLCAAEELNKVEVKRLRLYSLKLPALNGFHMTVRIGVREDIALGLDNAQNFERQEQCFPRNTARLMEPSGQLAAAARQAVITVRTHDLQTGSQPSSCSWSKGWTTESDAVVAGEDPEVPQTPFLQLLSK